jgi:hypothetical protein
MKASFKYYLHIALFFVVFSIDSISLVEAQSFANIQWNLDTNNSPRQDKSGSGRTPSTSGATNNQGTFRFEISTTNTSATQRQEFLYERRSGYHRFSGEFQIDSRQPDFNRVSIAQTHDNQTGSAGVFSIYQVRRSGNGYVFGVQGDTVEARNGYSVFDTVNIELDRWYRLETRTLSSTRDGSFEVGQLFDSNGRLVWEETIFGGGENQQYKKVGAYRLTNGSGRVIVDWRRMRFYTGQ